MTEVYRYPKPNHVTENRNELIKVNEELTEVKKELTEVNLVLKKMKDIVFSNSSLIADLTKAMGKLVKMLCDPNYGTNYLNDKEKEIKEKE